MKRLSDLKLVYAGYTQDLTNAADRRRFPYFLKTRNLAFEFSWKVKPCDFAYITDVSDLSGWCDYKDKRGKDLTLIMELVDMPFHYPASLSTHLKGSLRYLSGRESHLSFRATKALERACRMADVIICASKDQRDFYKKFNDNVHITMDRFEPATRPEKSDFSLQSPIKVGWEGQPYTLDGVNVIAEALNHFSDKIEIHLVTKPTMKGLLGNSFPKSTLTQIPDVKCPVIIHEWTIENHTKDVMACDFTILPLDHQSFAHWAKPANRLLSHWHLNLPVVTSASRAFKDLQESAGLDLYCRTTEDWKRVLGNIIGISASERKEIAETGYNYAKSNFNDDALMQLWSAALMSCDIIS